MIYCFYGNNQDKILERSSKLLAGLKKRQPGISVRPFPAEQISAAQLSDLAQSQDMFEKRHVVVGSKWFSPDFADVIIDVLPVLAESVNIFILKEGVLSKKNVDALEKAGAKLEKIDRTKEAAKPAFNIFSLAEALGRRDKKNIWILYQKAGLAGLSPEEIHGVIMWQVKSMLLAKTAKSAAESGLKTFVFSKAVAYAKNFPGNELENLSWQLLSVYHDARRGLSDLELGLERLILSI